MSWMGKS